VRAESNKRYPTDEEDQKKRTDALRKAFERALKASIEEFATEALDGVEYIWSMPGKGPITFSSKLGAPTDAGTTSGDGIAKAS
jgi:hypothetical protein